MRHSKNDVVPLDVSKIAGKEQEAVYTEATVVSLVP